MIVAYPIEGASQFHVEEGSEGRHDRAARLIWIREPSNNIRAFNRYEEVEVPNHIAVAILSDVFGVDESDQGVDAETAEPDNPAVLPFEFMKKPERYRKFHHRICFYGNYEAPIPVGSRLKITPRGVAVALPAGGLKLYGPKARVLLTPTEEAALLSQIPKDPRGH